MLVLFRGCFGIVASNRSNADTGGRLGVSLPPPRLLSKTDSLLLLLRLHSFIHNKMAGKGPIF